MKKYFSFFRMRFIMGLQYRTAALAGFITQFFWGAMEILIFVAFYRTDAAAFPMSMEATSSYIWLQQAFLAFFGAWMMEYEIFETISNGNIAYELCRPIDIYDMWYVRNVATRLSRAVLRCFPILLVAALLPKPYGISAPVDIGHFVLFLFTLILGLAVMVSLHADLCPYFFYHIRTGTEDVVFPDGGILCGSSDSVAVFPGQGKAVHGVITVRIHAECTASHLQRQHERSGNADGNYAAGLLAHCADSGWQRLMSCGGKESNGAGWLARRR